MKLTDKQAQTLYLIAFESLRINGNVFSIEHDIRQKLVNDILNQQDEVPKKQEKP
jgi:hypothetical protein